MTGQTVTVRGAGRTDAGVHARAQVCNFTIEARHPLIAFVRGVNAYLPRDIGVLAAEEVGPEFDARRAARGKHYAYRFWTHEARAPLVARTSWHYPRPLDAELMRAGGAELLGEHDFSSFRAADCEAKHPVRVLTRVEPVWAAPSLLELHVEGTAFLKNMVRIIAGTLAEVGEGKRPPAGVGAALAARDRLRAGKTAPAHGLTLEAVRY
jgi:tRNA pseudouridine38-40 synthase